MIKRNFYFNEVIIERTDNPHGLLDFELIDTNVLKLSIDSTKNVDKSSITLTKKELNFPDSIEWYVLNKSIYRIPLKVEFKDKNDKNLRHFWMTCHGLYNNNVIIDSISEYTEKVVITVYHENVLKKNATLIITSNN